MAPGIIDGQPVNAAASNPAWLAKNGDDTTVGKVGLANVEAASGPSLPVATGLQRVVNGLVSFVGTSLSAVYNALPSWTNNDVGVSTNTLFQRSDALTERFNPTTGHTHAGTAGQGPKISAPNLADVPLVARIIQGSDRLAVTGTSTIVTGPLTGKPVSTSSSVAGVVSTAPENKIVIRQASGASQDDDYTDALGNVVYARLTWLASVWTMSFFVNLSGTETAYSFGSASDIRWYYQQLFSPFDPAIPVYSEYAIIPSDNATADVVDASSTQRGLMNTLSQTLAGIKTWVNGLVMQAYYATQRLDVASAASITALASTKSFVKFTGVTVTDLHGVTAGVDGQVVVLYNGTSVIVTLKNESGSASASNRIVLPGGTDMPMSAGSSMALAYDTGQSRWVPFSGGGGAVGSSDLLPTLDITYNIGSAVLRWLTVHALNFVGYADAYFNEVRVGRGAGNDPENLAVGKNALATNATGTVNTAVGRNALRLAAAGDVNACVALGNRALDALTSGNYNTALGHSAAAFLVSGDRNTSIGSLSGPAGGSDNFACGQTALTNTIGNDNTGVGNGALNANYTGASNAAIGKQSLVSNTTGSGNTGVGFESLFAKDANYNVGIGYRALKNATTGDNNVGIGANAGMDTNPNVAGSDNTYIGANTGNSVAGTLTKAVAIGSGALVGASSTVAIGGTGGNAVKVGVNIAAATARMHLPAGVAAAGGAPLKINSGTNLTTTEDGAIESNGSDLFWTNSSLVRKSLTSGGSAAGYGGLVWLEDANAPTSAVDNLFSVYQFSAGLGQQLYAVIRIPNGYTAGTQIFLRSDWYSNDTSGTALISSEATLIRAGTDLISSTTNQRTSTNTAVTMSGATQNIPQALALDLTSATGQINAVAVAAGDLIKIRFFRGTDTGASDLSVPVQAMEVTS